MADGQWRRVAGLRVVMSGRRPATPPFRRSSPGGSGPARRVCLGVLLIVGGTAAVLVAVGAQRHAPQPSGVSGGCDRSNRQRSVGPALTAGVHRDPRHRRDLETSAPGPQLRRHDPGALAQRDARPGGLVQVLSHARPDRRVGHRRTRRHPHQGPGVFFRRTVFGPARTSMCGWRTEPSLFSASPASGGTSNRNSRRKLFTPRPGMRRCGLITCGGDFDPATGHYLSSTVVFAALTSAR